ncbi:MAG: DUF1318 domain-containing protein, partial [Sphingomonadaceae bacterium]
MTKNRKIIIGLGAAFVLATGMAGIAYAQASAVSAALASGDVGEQADGYLGFRNAPASDVKAEVDKINIQRRALYT